jgi:hypothetical protein
MQIRRACQGARIRHLNVLVPWLFSTVMVMPIVGATRGDE